MDPVEEGGVAETRCGCQVQLKCSWHVWQAEVCAGDLDGEGLEWPRVAETSLLGKSYDVQFLK